MSEKNQEHLNLVSQNTFFHPLDNNEFLETFVSLCTCTDIKNNIIEEQDLLRPKHAFRLRESQQNEVVESLPGVLQHSHALFHFTLAELVVPTTIWCDQWKIRRIPFEQVFNIILLKSKNRNYIVSKNDRISAKEKVNHLISFLYNTFFPNSTMLLKSG